MSKHGLAMQIVHKLRSHGHTAYFAGGWVRDYLLGLPHDDIDVATDASPEQVQSYFEKTVMVGANFGVVVVNIEGNNFEVASFRKEGLYVDGRRPEHVEFASPEEDAERRDFTINGMFYDPVDEKVIDFVGGKEDLEKRLIHAIGDVVERFREDRLRMIRAVRFSACLGFEIHPETRAAIEKFASDLLPAVSVERIWQEFEKLGGYPAFGPAMVDMQRLGLLQTIFPTLKDQSLEAIQEQVSVYQDFPEPCPMVLFLMELFPESSLDQQIEICRALRSSNQDIKWLECVDKVRCLVNREIGPEANPEPVEWVRVYADDRFITALTVVAARLRMLGLIPEHQERILELAPHIQRMREKNPVLGSKQLQEAGISPGKQMGELLRQAERLSINGNIFSPEQILEQLKALPEWSSL